MCRIVKLASTVIKKLISLADKLQPLKSESYLYNVVCTSQKTARQQYVDHSINDVEGSNRCLLWQNKVHKYTVDKIRMKYEIVAYTNGYVLARP
jgi:phosphomannomutase